MISLRDAYRGRRVLVTGHTGFKGGWLALWLERLGAKVVGYALAPPSRPSLFEAAGIESSVSHVQGDIRDAASLDRVLSEHRPEILFHLAAQPLVRLAYEQPDSTFEVNVMGTLRVFEAVRRADSVRALVNVSSDKCYENREWVWGYRENDPMGGFDPYSASKGCAELLFSAWLRSYFDPARHGDTHRIGAASARAGNVIGGGDWGRDRLVPDCMRALGRGAPIVLRSPGAVRPWQHVLEPLAGYLRLGAGLMTEPARHAGAWNFGPGEGQAWTVEAMVSALCRLWGEGAYRVDPTPQPHEARSLRLDCTKAHVELGWRPRWGTLEALEETVRWHRLHHAGGSPKRMKAFTVEQIEAYEAATSTSVAA